MARFCAFLLPFMLLLAACDPGPAQKCDYCRAMRTGVQRFVCDKCTKPHAACDSEKSVLHYSEGRTARGYVYWSATSILTCPATPEDSAVLEPVAEKPAPEKQPDTPETLTPMQRGALCALLVLVTFLTGYGAGKMRRGMVIKLENGIENKKGVVS